MSSFSTESENSGSGKQSVHPPASGPQVAHVGSYRRRMPVSLARMYENTLDWEHLPWLHDSSFKAIDCLEAGEWGWRASLVSPRDEHSVIELRLYRDLRRWITRNLEGPNAGAEIWTHVFEFGERDIEVLVDFFVPGVPETHREAVGQGYARLYRQLYDEDEMMMSQRQAQLDALGGGATDPVEVGAAALVSSATRVMFAGKEYGLSRLDGSWIAWATRCPHQMGPLQVTSEHPGELECPWHGYRFDMRSGACTTGQSCRMPAAPAVIEKDGNLYLQQA